jgi:hypothetical protein
MSEVEIDVTALQLETSAGDLELETDAIALELETRSCSGFGDGDRRASRTIKAGEVFG